VNKLLPSDSKSARSVHSASGFAPIFWSGRWDSNPRHPAWEADTLPTELRPRCCRAEYSTGGDRCPLSPRREIGMPRFALTPESPATYTHPSVYWGRSSAGRALQSHCRGRGFESPRLHQRRRRGPVSPTGPLPFSRSVTPNERQSAGCGRHCPAPLGGKSRSVQPVGRDSSARRSLARRVDGRPVGGPTRSGAGRGVSNSASS
jgi:hypothetical protein